MQREQGNLVTAVLRGLARSVPRGLSSGVLAASLLITGCGDGARGATSACESGTTGYILPTDADAFRVVADRAADGPFIMLNLYRLREFADYSGSPGRAPETPLRGAEAFERLAATLDAALPSVGAEVVFRAEGGLPLIGPSDERWDIVQLVRYPSYDAFAQFAASETVLASVPDRLAVLEDSRVIPLVAIEPRTPHDR